MQLIPYFNQNAPARELLRAFWGVDNQGSVVAWAPRLDVYESKDAYRIRLDLPGVDKKDIEASVEDGVLTVRGTRRDESEEKTSEGTWHRQERHFGAFQRSLNLGEGVDADAVRADYKDGVLSLLVPKKAVAKARVINIA